MAHAFLTEAVLGDIFKIFLLDLNFCHIVLIGNSLANKSQ
jgi:hypothetical protein